MDFDYDSIDEWAPRLTKLLMPLLPADIGAIIKAANPQYVEDARRMVLAQGDRRAIIDAILEWLKASTVMAYHGTRVSAEEADSIERDGFRPLKVAQRRARLERALSGHPDWERAAARFDDVVTKFVGGYAGRREGQVHFTLSRAGLGSFDHYITHGAEVDQHMARELIGGDAINLLAEDGCRIVYRIGVPGEAAIKATHPYFSPEDIIQMGEIPNIVGEILSAWSFRFARPEYQSRNLQVDCGLVFRETVPASLILGKEVIGEQAGN